jgi:isocitrate lyase
MPMTFEDLVPAPSGRFDGIVRPYSAEDVERLRGSLPIEHTIARRGALKLWELLKSEDYIHALGALSGNQAMQMVRAGLKAIYLSGWQVAADANTAGQMYPDQSLYPANAGPELARKSTRRSSAPTRSSIWRRRHPRLVRADRRRCRGRLRRAAQLLRDHEGLHRRRRRRGAL